MEYQFNGNPGANSQYKSSGNHTSIFKLELSLINLTKWRKVKPDAENSGLEHII